LDELRRTTFYRILRSGHGPARLWRFQADAPERAVAKQQFQESTSGLTVGSAEQIMLLKFSTIVGERHGHCQFQCSGQGKAGF
jgi:hypothetical protein